MVKLVKSAGETVSASSTPADPKFSALSCEIALIAVSIEVILASAIEVGDDFINAAALMDGARRLALQIGYLADLSGQRSEQRTHIRGGAEDWLLPPDCALAADPDGAPQ